MNCNKKRLNSRLPFQRSKTKSRSVQREKKKEKRHQNLIKREGSGKKQTLSTREHKLGEEFKDLRRIVEDAKESKKQSASQSRALQMLMTLQDEHNIGIYGRLGDLGAIDSQYDSAIRTTAALNHIVVQTESDAKFCVEFLRAKDLGVQTFVILDKVSNLSSQIDKFSGAPEGVPRSSFSSFSLSFNTSKTDPKKKKMLQIV